VSSHEEILEVYLSDISEKGKTVYNKKGITPFLAGLTGCYVFNLYDGVIPVFDLYEEEKCRQSVEKR
jgi:hypothetical protein